MKVTVTGATGHLGANLTRMLLEKDHEVKAFAYGETHSIDGLDVEIIKGDIRDLKAIKNAIKDSEVVYHLAALISIIGPQNGLVNQVNVGGTQNVIKACLQHDIRRLVHCSSGHVFQQNPMDKVIDEQRPTVHDQKAPAYDRSKALAELEIFRAIEEDGLDAVIINPSNFIGRNDFRPSRQGQVMLKLYHGEYPALPAGGYDWTDVRAVAKAAITAESKGRTGEKYILSGRQLSIREFAKEVEAVTGRKSPKQVVPLWVTYACAPFAELYSKVTKTEPLLTREALHALNGNSNFSHAKASKELGYQLYPIRETIEDSFAWFEQADMLKN